MARVRLTYKLYVGIASSVHMNKYYKSIHVISQIKYNRYSYKTI